jgi:hypothetical protein
LRSSVSSHSRACDAGTSRMSTFPVWNSATAVLTSGMMRLSSESISGGPSQ